MSSQERINKIASVIDHSLDYDSFPSYWLDDPKVLEFVESVKDKCMSQFYTNGMAFLCYGEPNHSSEHLYDAAVQAQFSDGIQLGLSR